MKRNYHAPSTSVWNVETQATYMDNVSFTVSNEECNDWSDIKGRTDMLSDDEIIMLTGEISQTDWNVGLW